ncbi:MAG TPA: hypothetical protein VHB68_17775 [Steroidobacteraceae bacterium]|nr:hypothetical protein [Steroidobacteraceae bacterium]
MESHDTVTIPAQHPAFDGHFPGAPLLPGVVLLDEMLRRAPDGQPRERGEWTIATAKFLRPVHPGETLTFEYESLANGSVRFAVRSVAHPVASGTLTRRAAHGQDDGHQTG